MSVTRGMSNEILSEPPYENVKNIKRLHIPSKIMGDDNLHLISEAFTIFRYRPTRPVNAQRINYLLMVLPFFLFHSFRL